MLKYFRSSWPHPNQALTAQAQFLILGEHVPGYRQTCLGLGRYTYCIAQVKYKRCSCKKIICVYIQDSRLGREEDSRNVRCLNLAICFWQKGRLLVALYAPTHKKHLRHGATSGWFKKSEYRESLKCILLAFIFRSRSKSHRRVSFYFSEPNSFGLR
jgi:hypothetical protein